MWTTHHGPGTEGLCWQKNTQHQ